MYQKWVNGTKISQLQQETDLSKEAIYKRFGRLRKENAQDDNVASNQDTEIAMADIEIEYVDKDIANEDLMTMTTIPLMKRWAQKQMVTIMN